MDQQWGGTLEMEGISDQQRMDMEWNGRGGRKEMEWME